MMFLDAEALRRAMNATRAGKLLDATALIQETLGRQGLIGETANADSPPVSNVRNTGSYKGRQPAREIFTCGAGTRQYVIHRPKGTPQSVLLMLHGCTQTPEDFAVGTDIVEAAHGQGLIVVLPAQSRGDNALSGVSTNGTVWADFLTE